MGRVLPARDPPAGLKAWPRCWPTRIPRTNGASWPTGRAANADGTAPSPGSGRTGCEVGTRGVRVRHSIRPQGTCRPATFIWRRVGGVVAPALLVASAELESGPPWMAAFTIQRRRMMLWAVCTKSFIRATYRVETFWLFLWSGARIGIVYLFRVRWLFVA